MVQAHLKTIKLLQNESILFAFTLCPWLELLFSFLFVQTPIIVNPFPNGFFIVPSIVVFFPHSYYAFKFMQVKQNNEENMHLTSHHI
jgi:hypothetical protein